MYRRADYSEFNYCNNKRVLEDDFEVFNKHSSFDVESLDSEKLRNQIKISLLQEMLRKKPHYAKYFTELEDEMDDESLFISNHKSMRAMKEIDPTMAMADYRNRLSSMFRVGEKNTNSVSLNSQ